MSKSAYGAPLLKNVDEVKVLQALPLLPGSSGQSEYDEKFIQDLVFAHPECLPVDQIDQGYQGLIPICCELSTPAGPLDVLYVTTTGRICILEAKLWRNPEARRKVVGQILDYAKELSRWDYDDLQRQVSQRTGRKGNALYEIATEYGAEVSESDFVDGISKSLAAGRFLLLILGDGIREGVSQITDYMERAGGLEFTFGLVELAIFRAGEQQLLLLPRVLAKTVVIKRSVIRVQDSQIVVDVEHDAEGPVALAPKQLTEGQLFYSEFWGEFAEKLSLDDKEQDWYKPGRTENFNLPMPPSGSEVWVSAFFMKSKSLIGVYLRFTDGSYADIAYAQLKAEQQQIEEELGMAVEWTVRNGKQSIIATLPLDDPWNASNRQKIQDYFSETLNTFVNVFRPRLQRISEDI
ncbi:MAG: DUF4268 domain-containing protein [Halioglobus sp.]